MPWTQDEMCKITAQLELRDNLYVNLGIGIPTKVANYIPQDFHVIMQSENGMLGFGPFPYEGEEDPDLINAGKQTITALAESSYFDSATSFAMIRGSHIDLALLGALEVSESGDLANWTIPGKMMKGMGGAMDLVANVKRVVIIMEHLNKNSKPKLVKNCNLPLTGINVVDRIVTDLGVFDVTPNGLKIFDVAPGVTTQQILDSTEARILLP